MTSRSLGHRAPLLWLVVPMMAGLVLGRAIEGVPVFWPLGLALAAAVLAIVGGARKAWFAAPMLVVAMLFAGIASYALHRARIAAWDALPPREARLELRIDRTFPQADAKKTSGLATIVAAEEHLKELRGQRLYFSLALRPGEPLPARSAVVRVVGVLVTLPRNPPVDTFDGYLAGAGMNFRLTRGRIDATVRDASGYQRFRSRALARLAEILGAGVD
jgi:competence protein ComEC